MRPLLTCFLALLICGCEQADEKEQLLDRALSAHGGYDSLKSAASWVAEVRRHQRGESYELRNYYRPGMIRLEMDLGNGERSADVIGHPHCWGKNGPMTLPCSAETRENDRPRVVMEMAAQIWPLRGKDWTLLDTAVESGPGIELDVLRASYEPLDSQASLRFRQDNGLLHSISVDGIKGGLQGTHTHVYSNFERHCGVLMPMHNVKSFEEDVWVEEDILQIECADVDESIFIRPGQVAEGFIDERMEDEQAFVCTETAGAATTPFVQRHIGEDGRVMFCTPGNDGASEPGRRVSIPASKQLSIYSLEPLPANTSKIVEALQEAARVRAYEMKWPVRVMIYDHDGMGSTGEMVIEAAVAVVDNQ